MGNSSKRMARRRASRLMVIRGDGSRSPPRKPIAREESLFPVVIEFRRGSSAPVLRSVDLLYHCAQWLAKRRGERVTVVGHANSRGSDNLAHALARERVAAVTKLLLLLGAQTAQLVSLATTRLHTVRVGSSLEERRRRRVVVVFRHEPQRQVLGLQRRRVPGRRTRRAAASATH